MVFSLQYLTYSYWFILAAAKKYKTRPSSIMGVHLPSSPNKVLSSYPLLVALLVIRARRLARQYYGKDPDIFIFPYGPDQLNWLLQTIDDWPIALSGFTGSTDNHYPPDPLIQFAKIHPFIFPKVTLTQPIPNALTIFTDGSSNGQAAYVVNNQSFAFLTLYTSAQLVELNAVLDVFKKHWEPFNLYTDSAYVAYSVPHLETTPFIKPTSEASNLFSQLSAIIRSRSHSFYIGHLRAHTNLPGPLTEGNSMADTATKLILISQTDPLAQAIQTHNLHHLNSQALHQAFKITREQAREIVRRCSFCVTALPVPHIGVNPWGLLPNDIWQMDVTHINEFGKLKYIHVTIDTVSGFIFASLHTDEASKNVIAHVLQCLSVMGSPKTIKTDNGPGYTGKNFQYFCKQLNVKHITGIPYNPQGQGIAERAHQTLKALISKIKVKPFYEIKNTPKNILAHALFILNILNLDSSGKSAADHHWHTTTSSMHALARWRDPLTNQ